MSLQEKLSSIVGWTPPALPEEIPHGDMPGDKVCIGEEHLRKAGVIFPALLRALQSSGREKAVVAVFGGSGVGKSEIASVLAAYLRAAGIGSYVMSGDNYPRRIPMYNDAERARIFRAGGLRALVDSGAYSDAVQAALSALWETGADADPKAAEANPWLAVYQAAGRSALAGYLGTAQEQDYDEVNAILDAFRSGAPAVWLKRMGRRTSAGTARSISPAWTCCCWSGPTAATRRCEAWTCPFCSTVPRRRRGSTAASAPGTATPTAPSPPWCWRSSRRSWSAPSPA